MAALVLFPLLAADARAGVTNGKSAYVCGSLGAQFLGYQDLDKYFDTRGYGYSKPDFQTTASLAGDLGLGYQFQNRLGVELGADFGPSRSVSFVSTTTGPAMTRHWQGSVSAFYFMPTLRIPVEDGLFGRAFLNTVGFRMGVAFFHGRREDTNQLTGVPGSYDQSASAGALGLLYRIEQMLNDHASVGLELAYNLVHFDSIAVSNVSGNTAPNDPERNPDGTNASLDFSGPSVKLVLTGWWERPVRARKD
jgi:hypothetical protein